MDEWVDAQVVKRKERRITLWVDEQVADGIGGQINGRGRERGRRMDG